MSDLTRQRDDTITARALDAVREDDRTTRVTGAHPRSRHAGVGYDARAHS